MSFIPMDPELIRQLIADQTDIIAEASKTEEQRLANLACPVCYERGCTKKVETPRVVSTPKGPAVVNPFGDILPKWYAVCRNCETEFDPNTGVIRSSSAGVIREPQSDPHQS